MAWRSPAQSPGLMGAAVPVVAPHCLPQPAAITGRNQAWGSHSSPRHAPHSRRPQQPPGRPHRPLGRATAADPPTIAAGGGANQPLDPTHALSGTRLTWLVDLVGRLATAHKGKGKQDLAGHQAIGGSGSGQAPERGGIEVDEAEFSCHMPADGSEHY
jgi:hypothetical protein